MKSNHAEVRAWLGTVPLHPTRRFSHCLCVHKAHELCERPLPLPPPQTPSNVTNDLLLIKDESIRHRFFFFLHQQCHQEQEMLSALDSIETISSTALVLRFTFDIVLRPPNVSADRNGFSFFSSSETFSRERGWRQVGQLVTSVAPNAWLPYQQHQHWSYTRRDSCCVVYTFVCVRCVVVIDAFLAALSSFIYLVLSYLLYVFQIGAKLQTTESGTFDLKWFVISKIEFERSKHVWRWWPMETMLREGLDRWPCSDAIGKGFRLMSPSTRLITAWFESMLMRFSMMKSMRWKRG